MHSNRAFEMTATGKCNVIFDVFRLEFMYFSKVPTAIANNKKLFSLYLFLFFQSQFINSSNTHHSSELAITSEWEK
jgi:hypothetical protein